MWRPAEADPPGLSLSLPNLITLARILLVPVMVWAIASDQMTAAFTLFLIAGISDGVDGFLAKRFGMATAVGAYLDPLADKVLIVSIYVSLGIIEAIPRWLVILVVSRDILIVGGIMLSWVLGDPITIKPATVSRLNTVAQILLGGVVIAARAFQWQIAGGINALMGLVAVLTLLSIAVYLQEWVRHVGGAGQGSG
ncbi:MAG: CDP-alcohol phosphatidyltransferase family protein [Xanthobacteraceae bacterium]|jgi:cardiolipin synthase|nr:CDP-alcohol phosphatidyltransferase family protein [Xanthobacteraceae bacterium]MBV9630983.1 CDP-alcohol phosphatidyltransferase family protein [Xanthobacteraceae bacterium]